MEEEIAKIKENSIKEMENSKDLKSLNDIRVKYSRDRLLKVKKISFKLILFY